ncbi:hypothetical protein P4640_18935 [Priestia aryabhattai]|uniref:hypothetical protein n=1 Tax=Priestia aryabhattai TaxID=412384 RepID=UPI002E1A905B|nr:hypothetical protein [Priestia aryabhattai]
MDIKNIVSNGFSLNDLEKRVSSFAFFSLRTAINSYFSTYKSSKHFFGTILSDNSLSQLESDFQYGSDYIEKYAETIIHFQHFIELVCKEILRDKHELLVLKLDKKHELFYKLLFKEEVDSSDLEGINTTEFTATFERMCELIKTGKLDSKYDFFREQKNVTVIKQLNNLRNRIWHRGTFVLRFKALDLFIGRYILPLIIQIVKLPEYKKLDNLWKYTPLSYPIDPLKDIIDECTKENYDTGKVAFLKELGRAAYSNPLNPTFKFFNDEIIRRSERMVEAEINLVTYSEADKVYNCPVCGVESLISYQDSEREIEEDGSYSSYFTFCWYIKCQCCSFEISNELNNPKEYGYDLPDYWYVIEH